MQRKLLKNDPYLPAEDTFFLEDCIRHEKGFSALDIGSGSGYLTKILEKSFSFVVGTDVNFLALQNQNYKTQNLVCCNGADAIKFSFDLVICNMPYLATEEILDVATDGGKDGFEIPSKIINSVKNCIKPGGKFLFVTSSLSNYSKLIQHAKDLGFEVSIKDKKKLFFEELILIEARS